MTAVTYRCRAGELWQSDVRGTFSAKFRSSILRPNRVGNRKRARNDSVSGRPSPRYVSYPLTTHGAAGVRVERGAPRGWPFRSLISSRACIAEGRPPRAEEP
jgi:hypothetical protein